MNTTATAPLVMFLLISAAGLTLLLMVLLSSWVKLGREKSFFFAAGTTVAALAAGFYRHGWSPELEDLCAVIFVTLAVPFGLKLVRAWMGIQVSPQELSGGTAGIFAWLSPGNLVVAVVLAGCAAKAFDYPFFGVCALLIGSLLIQPLANSAGADEATPMDAEPSLASEREKVLSLLETDRITAEEAADLLNALGATAQAALPVERLSLRRRLVLIGAGLVLIGFFLPWLSINPAKELSRVAEEMQNPMMDLFSGIGGHLKTPTVQIYGGDVQRGLGWLVLFLGLGSAALPYVATTMDRATQRMVSLMALGIGGIVLVYLLSQNFRFLDIGLAVVLAGYVVELVGALPAGARSVGMRTTAARVSAPGSPPL